MGRGHVSSLDGDRAGTWYILQTQLDASNCARPRALGTSTVDFTELVLTFHSLPGAKLEPLPTQQGPSGWCTASGDRSTAADQFPVLSPRLPHSVGITAQRVTKQARSEDLSPLWERDCPSFPQPLSCLA